MAAGDNPFAKEQQLRLQRAVHAATAQSGMRFVVRFGAFGGEPATTAARWLASFARPEEEAVLVAIGPAERLVEVVTTAAARHRLSDQACALATLSMTTSFGVGDLVGGLVNGLRMLADTAGRPQLPAGQPTR